MTWNWNAPLSDIVYMDLETQSLVDLRKEGGRAYAAHPSTRISLAAFRHGERKTLWVHPAVPAVTPPAGWELTNDLEWLQGKTLCAHNAGEFDKLVWQHCGMPEMPWIDALPIGRAAGLPGSLDKIGQTLFGRGKDSRGYGLINMLCVAKFLSGEVVYPIATAAAWTIFADYCCRDVDLLAEYFPLVYRYAERDLLRVHQQINDRGIPVDVPFASRLVELQEELKILCGREFERLTTEAERTRYQQLQRDTTAWGIDIDDAGSGKKILAWMQKIGIKPPTKDGKPTLDRKALDRLFREPEGYADAENEATDGAIQALRMRAEMTRATAGKAKAALKAAHRDGRARGQHVYYGAHTGRFSGRELQPHNFLRGVKGLDVAGLCRADLSMQDVVAAALTAECTASDIIATLLRPMLRIRAVADFGAIEARGVAWFCNEEAELATFREWDADPYIPLACQIFGRQITKADELERWVAKQAILGAGYGMSWMKFITYCAAQDVDLAKVGVDAKAVIGVYRETHKAITGGWRLVHEAAHAAVGGRETEACKCRFYMQDKCLHIQLPSGRPIVYRNPRIVMEIPGWAVLYGIRADPAPTLVYDHPHGYRGMLYGGRIMENIVQGGMRDVLAEALIRAEDAGLLPVIHVHDEIGCDTDDIHELVRLMSLPPTWAADFPVKVEGWVYDRYVKAAPRGAVKCEGLNGEIR